MSLHSFLIAATKILTTDGMIVVLLDWTGLWSAMVHAGAPVPHRPSDFKAVVLLFGYIHIKHKKCVYSKTPRIDFKLFITISLYYALKQRTFIEP